MDPFIYFFDFEDCFQLDLSGNPLTYVVGSYEPLTQGAPYIIYPIEEPSQRVCATYITASTSTATTHYTDVNSKFDDCPLCLEANGQVVTVTGILKPEISSLNLFADSRFKKGDVMHVNIVYDDSGTLMFINSPVIIENTSVYTATGSTIPQIVPFAPYSTFRQVIESKGVYYLATDCSGGTETVFLSHQEIRDYGVIVKLPLGDSPCKKVLTPITVGEYSLISGVTTVLRSSEVFSTCEDCLSTSYSSNIDETFSTVTYTASTITDFFDGEDSIILVGSGLTHANSDKLYTVGNIVEVKYDGTINTNFNKISFGSFTTNNDNYLYLSGRSIFDFTGDFTVEFWVNYSSGDTDAGFVSYYDNDAEEGWQIRLDSTYLAFDYNSDTIVTSLEPTLGEWNHVAVVRDGTDLTVFLNGTGETTSSVSDTITVGSGISLKIGSNSSGNTYIDGYMTSIRICQSTVYAGDFDPQTTPLTVAQGSFGNINSLNSEDTVLLLNFKSEVETYKDDSEYNNPIYFRKVIAISTNSIQNESVTFETYYEGEPLKTFQEIELPDGFLINFFDSEYTNVFVNPNSYLTFGQGSNSGGLNLPQDIESEVGAPGVFISTLGSGYTDDNRTFIDKISTAFTDNGETFLVKVEGDYSVQPRMVLTQCMCNTIINNSRVPLQILYEVCTGNGVYSYVEPGSPIGFNRTVVSSLGRTKVCSLAGGSFRFFTAVSLTFGPPGCGGSSGIQCGPVDSNTPVSSQSLPTIFQDITINENGTCTEFLDTEYIIQGGGGTNASDSYVIVGYTHSQWGGTFNPIPSWSQSYLEAIPNNWVCGQGCSNNLVIDPYFITQGLQNKWTVLPENSNSGGEWGFPFSLNPGFYNRWARFKGNGQQGPRLLQENVFEYGGTYSVKFDVYIHTNWCTSSYPGVACCDSYSPWVRIFAGGYSTITPGGGDNYVQIDILGGSDPTPVSGPYTFETEITAVGADLSFTAKFNCNTPYNYYFNEEGLYISNICVTEISPPPPPPDICKCVTVNWVGPGPNAQYGSNIRWNGCDGTTNYAWLTQFTPTLQICVLNSSLVGLVNPQYLQVINGVIGCTGIYCQTPPCNCYRLKVGGTEVITYENCSGIIQSIQPAGNANYNLCARRFINVSQGVNNNLPIAIDVNNGSGLCPNNCSNQPTPTPTPTRSPIPVIQGCVVLLQRSLPDENGNLLFIYNVNTNTTIPLPLSGDTTGVRDIALSQAPTGRLYEILNSTNQVRYWDIDFIGGTGGGAPIYLDVPVVTGWEIIAQGLGVSPDGTTLWYSRQAMIGTLLTNRIYAYDTITQTNLPNFIQLPNGRTVWGDIIINSNNTKLFVLTRTTQTINGVAPSIDFEQYDISNLAAITQECVFNLTAQNSSFSPASATDLDMFMTNGILYILRKSNQFGEQVWTLSQNGILSTNPVQGLIPSFGSSGTVQGAASYPQCAVDVTGAPWECFDGLDERCLPLMVFPGLPTGSTLVPGSPASVGFWDFSNGTAPQLVGLDTAPAITYSVGCNSLNVCFRTMDIAHTMDFNTNVGRMWILHSVGGNPTVRQIHEWILTYVPGTGGIPDGFTTQYQRVISFPANYRVGTGLAARTNTRLITTRYTNSTTPNGPNVVIELNISAAGNITLNNTTITDMINLPSAGQSFWTSTGVVTLPSAPGTFVTYGDLMLTDNTNQLIIIGKLSTTTNTGLPNNLSQTTHTVLLQYNYVAGTYWPNFIRYYADTTANQQVAAGTNGVDRSLIQYLNNLYLVRVIFDTSGQQTFRVSRINTVNGNLSNVGNGIVPGTAGTGIGAFIGPYGSSSARRIGGTSDCGTMMMNPNVPGCRCHNVSTVTGGQGQFIARRCDNFANATFNIGGGVSPVSEPVCFIQNSYQNVSNTVLSSVGADCILCVNNTFICGNNCPSPTPTPTITKTQTVTPTLTKTPTMTKTPTQTRLPILPPCCVLLNSTNSSNLWYFDVTANTALQIYMPGGNNLPFRDIAISQTLQRYFGLFIPGGAAQNAIIYWNVNFQTGTLTSGPLTSTLGGVPSSYGEGLAVNAAGDRLYISRTINNVQNIILVNPTVPTAVETTLFSLQGRQVSGDIIVTSTGKLILVSRDNNNLYIEQWTTDNTPAGSSQDCDFNLTSVDPSFTPNLEIDIFVYDSQLYMVKPDGNPESLWSISVDGSVITQVYADLPAIGNIRGAASYPECNIWEFQCVDPRCAPLYIQYAQDIGGDTGLPNPPGLYPAFVSYQSGQFINFGTGPALQQHFGARGRIGIARTFDYNTDAGRLWVYTTQANTLNNGTNVFIDEWDYSFVPGTGFVIGNYRRRITVGSALNQGSGTNLLRTLGPGITALDNNTLIGTRAAASTAAYANIPENIVTIDISNGGIPGNFTLQPANIQTIYALPMAGQTITTSNQIIIITAKTIVWGNLTISDNQRIIMKAKMGPDNSNGNNPQLILQIDIVGTLEYAFLISNAAADGFANRWNQVLLYDQNIVFNRVTQDPGNWSNVIFNPVTLTFTAAGNGVPLQPSSGVYTNTGFKDSATPIYIAGISVCPQPSLPPNVI